MLVITVFVILAESVSAQGMWRPIMAPATVKLLLIGSAFSSRCEQGAKKKKKVKRQCGHFAEGVLSHLRPNFELAEVLA